MDTLASHIITFCLGIISTFLSQFLQPKITIRFWLFHQFTYTIPSNHFGPAPQGAPPNYLLLTQSVTVQNLGRKTADWIEIVHQRKPDFFQLHPPLNYTESTAATGEHTIRVGSLAPKEFFTIQFLCYSHQPQLNYIRSSAGHASPMPWMVVRQYSPWVYRLVWFLIMVGSGFCVYWLVRGGILAYRLLF